MSNKNESKHDKFVRISERRVNDILHRLDLIENLACENYEYSDDEYKKIFKEIENKVSSVKKTFALNKRKYEKFEL